MLVILQICKYQSVKLIAHLSFVKEQQLESSFTCALCRDQDLILQTTEQLVFLILSSFPLPATGLCAVWRIQFWNNKQNCQCFIYSSCMFPSNMVWFLCQSLIHGDFFSLLSSFQLHTMHKSVAFILCQKWKQGKRKAEKDEYQGFKFFLTLSPPQQEMDMRDV